MSALDRKLTGKDELVRNQPATPEEWLERGRGEWYLSDGGYSRFGFNDGTGRIFCTSNSLGRVKESWASAAEEIGRVETLLRAVYERHGYTFGGPIP